MRTLDLYSLPAGLSTMMADGAQKLLGSSEMSPADLLVRECAQNSWDARLPGQQPEYHLQVRHLDSKVMQILKGQVFTGINTCHFHELCGFFGSQKRHWAVEVADRNTTGLDGNPDPQVAPSDENESTNFRDLIFVYGATRDSDLGGGTYGFGKTAAFTMSRCGTVVYWTRCRFRGEYEYRLIATHVGESYTAENLTFTGRHWWGNTANCKSVLPLTGEVARILGEKIFQRHFVGTETGTNILVLDPRIDAVEETATHARTEVGNVDNVYLALAEAMRDSVIRDLWPKLTPGPDNVHTTPMRISVEFNGTPLEIGNPDEGLWSIWASALNSVRAEEQGETLAPEAVLQERTVYPVAYASQPKHQPKGFRRIGTLALTRSFPLATINPFDRVMAKYQFTACFMRAAELVVTYDQIPMRNNPTFYIAGVFKVAADTWPDEAFASAENPTHTEWNTGRLPAAQKNLVTHARREIRKAYDNFLAPQLLNEEAGRISTEIADSLSSLIPVDLDQPSEARPPQKRSGRHGKIKKLTIAGLCFRGLTADGTQQIQELTIETPSVRAPLKVEITVKKRGDSGLFPCAANEISFEWDSACTVCTHNCAELPANGTYNVKILAPSSYLLDIQVGEH